MFGLAAIFFYYEFALQVSPGIMANSLMSQFSINATTLGMVSGAYYFSYTAMQIPMGLFYGRFGARRMITIAAAICAFGALLFGLAPSASMLAVARFIMGIGSAFAFVGVLFVCLRWFPIKYFAIFAGITQTLGSIGAISGQGPLAMVVNYFGWRHTILAFAAAGFLISIGIWIFLRDRPEEFKELEEKQRVTIWKALKTVFSNQQTWPIALYSFAIWAPIVAIASLWGVPFISEHYQVSNVVAGNACAMIWLGTAIGSPIAGWVSHVVKRRSTILSALALLGLVSSGLAIYATDLPLSAMFFLCFIIGIAAGGQSLAFAVVKDNNSTSTSSAAMGFNNMAVVFGGALFQPLIGKLLDLHSNNQMIHGAPHYTLNDYQFALTLVPLCFLASTLVSMVWIRETFCKTTFIIHEETLETTQ